MASGSLPTAFVKRMKSSKMVGLEIDWKGFLNDAIATAPSKLFVLSAAGSVIFLLLPGGRQNVGRLLSWTHFFSSLLASWWMAMGARHSIAADFEEESAFMSVVGSHTIHLIGVVLSVIWFPSNVPRGAAFVSLALCYLSLYGGAAMRLMGYSRAHPIGRLLKATAWASLAESSLRVVQSPRDEPQVYLAMVLLVMAGLYRVSLYFDSPEKQAAAAAAPPPAPPPAPPAAPSEEGEAAPCEDG